MAGLYCIHPMFRLAPSMANTGNPDSYATEGQYIKANIPFSSQSYTDSQHAQGA